MWFDLAKRIELLANVAIIVVALLLGGVLVKRYLLPQAQPLPPQGQIQPGTKLSVSGVEWEKSDKTLLLVLSDTCHFCTESAGFYQRLAQEKSKQNSLRMIAVLPQDVSRGREYLNKLSVAVDDVRQSTLDGVGVRGTPTLILVDKAGAATHSWVGKLPANKEAEVLSHFQIERAGK